jgi:hypothetical protein
MNNIFIKILTFFLVIGISACSYKPIFSEQNYGFEIEKIILSGEKNINNIINSKLKSIKSDREVEKERYTLEIQSKKIREIVSKDSKGDPLKFKMIIFIEYKVSKNGNILLNNKIEKNNVYNNDSDKFELEQTEDIILEKLTGNISDSIISSIINLNDN